MAVAAVDNDIFIGVEASLGKDAKDNLTIELGERDVEWVGVVTSFAIFFLYNIYVSKRIVTTKLVDVHPR
eukprot:5238278-Ditylum_brightwellii.AAC.1